jgi:hypothetical protein
MGKHSLYRANETGNKSEKIKTVQHFLNILYYLQYGSMNYCRITFSTMCRSYPSWLFKESSPLSSLNTSLSEPDLRTAAEDEKEEEEEEEGESEDEGWYSLSRTDLRKLQQGEGKGVGGVNLVLANCVRGEEEEREVESSQERNSYR